MNLTIASISSALRSAPLPSTSQSSPPPAAQQQLAADPAPASGEPGVAYQPSRPAEEPATYSAPSRSAQSTSDASGARAETSTTPASTASAPSSEPRKAGTAAKPGVSESAISDRVASALKARAVPEKDSGSGGDTAKVDVADLMAAYVKQFASSPREHLNQLLR